MMSTKQRRALARSDGFRQVYPCLTVVKNGTLHGIMKARKVDTAWFKARLESEGKSMRDLARELASDEWKSYDVARVSRIINGKYEPTVWELLAYARVFQVDVVEMLKRLGYRTLRH